EDVTKQAGVAHVGHSQAATFFDYDNDGRLDLFVTNTAEWTEKEKPPGQVFFPGLDDLLQLSGSRKEENHLYRNKGDGTFEDVTAKAGLKGLGWAGDTAVFDYDED